MFQFSNALLLLLFAAAAFDAVQGWSATEAGPGRLRRAFSLLWTQEHLLFTPLKRAIPVASRRLRLGTPLFGLGLAAYEVTAAFCNSMARENWAWVQGQLAPVLEMVAFFAFGIKILFCTKYNWRQLSCGGALYFIARWVYFNGQNIWWIGIVVAIFAAKDTDLHRAMGAYLASGGLSIALVLALHFAGIVAPGLTDNRHEAYRSTFGYGHPNTFGGLLLGLVFAYVLYRAAHFRWADTAVVLAGALFLWFGPNSRTAALCSFGLAALLALYCLCPKLWEKLSPSLLSILGPVTLVFFTVISYVFPLLLVKNGPWNNDFGPAWLGKLDHILTCRISLAWFAYRLLDVKIAGQFMPSFPGIDNSFVYALFQVGPVMTALIVLLLGVSLWGMAKKKRIPEYCCLLMLVPYAYMECQTFHLSTNPVALLLCSAVFALPLSRWER